MSEILLVVAIGALALLAYAILSVYVLPLVRFIRTGRQEVKVQQAASAAWQEEHFGISKNPTAGWVRLVSDDWVYFAIGLVIVVYLFTH